MKIIDSFIFGLEHELDLLDLRFEYLDSIVDHFVIVEAKFTHLGTPKELFFDLNKVRYKKYLHKIKHLILEKPVSIIPGSWDNEFYHRNQILTCLESMNLDDHDIIVMSDTDEFPSIESINWYKDNNEIQTLGLVQDLFYYYFNFKADIKWDGSQISRWINYKNGLTPQKIRDGRIPSSKIPTHGGWHFSYMGGLNGITKKLNAVTESGSVQHYINDLLSVKNAIDRKKVFFNDMTLNKIDIELSNLPLNIKERFNELSEKGYICP